MSCTKPTRIYIYRCYSVKNSILGIKDRKGRPMGGEHNVFVVKKSKSGKKVKVKTITSLENISQDGKRRFHDGALEAVRRGEIIVIPQCFINSKKLSGINRKGIWINRKHLYESKGNYIFPNDFLKIVIKDYHDIK